MTRDIHATRGGAASEPPFANASPLGLRRRPSYAARVRRDAKVVLTIVFGFGFVAVAGLVAVVWWLSTAFKPRQQPPLAEVPPNVTQSRTAEGKTVLKLRWTIAPHPRERCFSPIGASVKVKLPGGAPAVGADIIALWGTDYAERRRARDGTSTSLSAWACRAGTMHVFARLEGQGAANIPCRYLPHAGNSNRGPFAGFECEGVLDPETELDLPPPPSCPPSPLNEVVGLFAPGACFGLDALAFSHVPVSMIHVSGTSYEDFRPWFEEGGPAPRFEIPLGEPARALELSVGAHEPEAAGRFGELLQRLEAALGKPQTALPSSLECAAGSSEATWNFARSGVGRARVRAQLQGCEATRARSFELELEAAP